MTKTAVTFYLLVPRKGNRDTHLSGAEPGVLCGDYTLSFKITGVVPAGYCVTCETCNRKARAMESAAS